MQVTAIRFKDTPLYQKGHEGELIVSGELKRRGWFVIPSYDYSGKDDDKAPRMHGSEYMTAQR